MRLVLHSEVAMPTVSRAELDSEDIVAEFGLVRITRRKPSGFGTFDSMCRGKTKFESKVVSDRAARRRRGLVSFRCKYCGCWHIGNHLDR